MRRGRMSRGRGCWTASADAGRVARALMITASCNYVNVVLDRRVQHRRLVVHRHDGLLLARSALASTVVQESSTRRLGVADGRAA